MGYRIRKVKREEWITRKAASRFIGDANGNVTSLQTVVRYYCTNCRSELSSDGFKFCPYCGVVLEGVEEYSV